MNEVMLREVAEQAYREENLPWSVSAITPNPNNPDDWEIYFDAWGRKYHKILMRVTPTADTTRESLMAEVREFLRSLKKSGLL